MLVVEELAGLAGNLQHHLGQVERLAPVLEQALLELRLPGSSVLQHPRGVLPEPLDHPLRRRIYRVRDRGGHDLIDVLCELLHLLGSQRLH